MTSIILIASFIIALFLNIPVAIALGLSSLLAILFSSHLSMDMIVVALISGTDSFPLMAIPFFILSGYLMMQGGVSTRLVEFSKSLLSFVSGGLGMVTVFTSMIFASISGSGPATVAAIGGIMIPAMIKDGYSKKFSTSLAAAGGSLGPIIPPSIAFIIFGVTAGISITDLFLAGLLPGILLGVGLMILTYFVVRKNKVALGNSDSFNIKKLLHNLYESKWALLIPVIILGGIYGGLFTPTEAAIVATVYSMIVGVFIHKDLKIKEVPSVFAKASLTSGTVLILVATATIFARILTIENIPQSLADFLFNISSNEIIITLLIIVLLLLVGMVIETIAAIIILTPILLPITEQIGMDPVHLGVIMVVGLAIGMITPPVGVNLFVAARVGDIEMEKMFGWLIPIISILVILLIIIAFVPFISIYLPSLFSS